MPLSGRRLVIEPHFPRAEAIAKMGETDEMRQRSADNILEAEGWKLRNLFWSFHRKTQVAIYENPEGKIEWFLSHTTHAVDRLLSLLDCSMAWGLEQEARAVQTLGTLVRHHQLKAYLLTGMFIERSKRSGLLYVFRKLRPTIVLDDRGDQVRIRCCLCMHPIGYYEDTFAGAMTPTDDVIAFLMLMRGDEPMLWRRANQHAPWAPESGL